MSATAYEKVVIVSRKTELEELVQRFNTEQQARFYLEHAGRDFDPVLSSHRRYQRVLDSLLKQLPKGLKSQRIDRHFLPQFQFGQKDLIITVGQDGLVVNTAKYLDNQPIFALNPDPEHIDGVLLPFAIDEFSHDFERSLQQRQAIKSVTMAEARLHNGQSLLGFNDLFIGSQSHVSARYQISIGPLHEHQSSSGIIISTGAGSTGWMRSVFSGAAAVIEALGGSVNMPPHYGQQDWGSNQLSYAVREPFPSKTTGTSLVFGQIDEHQTLSIESHMADHGVIFSDGIESDYLAFNAGSTVSVGIADKKARMLVKD